MLNKEISKIWHDVLKQEDYSLYLHSPFCLEKCKYCVYTGKLLKEKGYKDMYRNYIDAYLPHAIENYKDIFNTKTPKSFYFGGGTPNIIKIDDMRKIFSIIPNFDNIPYKLIDLHAGIITDKQIDFIAESGFTTVCLGVQSFDEKTLKANNRLPVKLERLREAVEKFNSANIYTSIDLMCYITNYSTEDLQILQDDLDIAFKLNLDFIDINPNLHFVLQNREYATMFEKTVDDYIYNSDYLSEKEITKTRKLNNRYIYRVVKNNIADKFKERVLPYFADDFPYADNNIVGIGDLNNAHSTMSYVHERLFYIEKNINNAPSYEIKYIKQDSQHLNALKDFLNSYK